MRLLLISNSTNQGEPYLWHVRNTIKEFLGPAPVKALFLPYAAVTFPYEEYEARVSERFMETGHDIVSIHRFENPVKAVAEAEAIITGGGNTWKLLRMIHDNNLIEVVREKVLSGTPYIGWSAGANVACPTIMTTNDMPIVHPGSFDAFNLVPFQINPHYIDVNPVGHAGETREQRILEFTEANPDRWVIGLREGTALLVEDTEIHLIGLKNARIFRKGQQPLELGEEDNLSFLLR